MDDIVDARPDETSAAPLADAELEAVAVTVDAVAAVHAGGPSKVGHVKNVLAEVAQYLALIGYDIAASRLIDVLTFIEAQQERQGVA